MSTGAAIAADGLVDLYEFLRLYCWEEIPNLEKALKIAKPRHRQIVDESVDAFETPIEDTFYIENTFSTENIFL